MDAAVEATVEVEVPVGAGVVVDEVVVAACVVVDEVVVDVEAVVVWKASNALDCL